MVKKVLSKLLNSSSEFSTSFSDVKILEDKGDFEEDDFAENSEALVKANKVINVMMMKLRQIKSLNIRFKTYYILLRDVKSNFQQSRNRN